MSPTHLQVLQRFVYLVLLIFFLIFTVWYAELKKLPIILFKELVEFWVSFTQLFQRLLVYVAIKYITTIRVLTTIARISVTFIVTWLRAIIGISLIFILTRELFTFSRWICETKQLSVGLHKHVTPIQGKRTATDYIIQHRYQ